MFRRQVGFAVLFLAACAGSSPRAWAVYSIGFDRSGGVGINAFSVMGSLDFAPGESSPYQVFLYHAEQHITEGQETRSYQYTLGLTHMLDEQSECHMSLTYWRDTLTSIHYGGPSFGASNIWQTEPGEGANAWMEGPPRDILSVGVNADVFIFGTEVLASSTTRLVFDQNTQTYVLETVPATQTNAHMTQFHPSLMMDFLWFDAVKPFVTYGHYFYSRDPARLEDLLGTPHYSASVNQIGGLVGGFFSDSGETGLRVPLPAGFELSGELGAAKSETTREWATTQSAAVHWLFFKKRLDTKLEWNRAIQTGISTDVFTGGLTWMY